MARIRINKLDKMDTREFLEKINLSRQIVIVSHVNPDGDAVGSSIAMQRWLTSGGYNATIVLPGEAPSNINFIFSGLEEGKDYLFFSKDSRKVENVIDNAQLIICIDLNDSSRAEQIGRLVDASDAYKVLIDHHLNPAEDKFDLIYSKTDISSASELLFWLLMSMPGTNGDATKLPPHCAKALMTGMTTDTNNFANSVFPSTFDMAAALIAAGVDRDDILGEIYQNHSEGRFRLLGVLLSSEMNIIDNGVAFMILKKRTAMRYKIQEGDTEGFVNMPLGIGKVKISIFIKEQENKFRVSIRSKKGWSANTLAKKYFHGGGHENASGGSLTIPEDIPDVDSIAQYVRNACASFFSSDEQTEK